jgi:stage V sporulation protein SpoVS
MTSNAAGVAGDLAGTITTAGAMTITGGGAGTQATGQFVTELTVR